MGPRTLLSPATGGREEIVLCRMYIPYYRRRQPRLRLPRRGVHARVPELYGGEADPALLPDFQRGALPSLQNMHFE